MRPRTVAFLALLALALLAAIRIVATGGPSGFVVAGDRFVTAEAPADLAVVHHKSFGYDGQFVYRLALDPFTHRVTADGITLDNPPYRQQRIGLPFLVHALTAVTPLSTSVALVLVNVLALTLAAWAAAVLAVRLGRSPLWGLAVALSPGLVASFCRDLTEPLEIALLLAGVVAWLGGRRALAVLAFVAAVLTRETALAVLAGLGLVEVWRAGRGDRAARGRAALLLVPLAAGAAWQLWCRHVWGQLPLTANAADVGAPFHAMFTTLFADHARLTDLSNDALQQHLWLVERVLLLAFLGYVCVLLRRSRTPDALRVGWVLAALLALSNGWGRDVAFLRAANEAIVVGLLVLLGVRSRWERLVLAGTIGVSTVVAVVYGVFL